MASSEEAEAQFRGLLADSGVNLVAPTAGDVDRAWDVLAVFAGERFADVAPPETEGDLFLAQFGTHDWGAGEHFELNMTRQFTFYDGDGEYSHMTQLGCTFEFTVTLELRALGSGDVWSSDLPLAEFFEQARALPGFEAVRALGLRPQSIKVYYEAV